MQKPRESDDEDSSEEDDDDSVPGLQGRNRPDSDRDRDSDNDNDGEQKQRNQVDPMKLHFGYMKGMKGLFKDKNNNNQKKTRKMSKIIQDRIVSMYKGDESEVNHNIITPNTKPIQYQSITKNRSVYKNKDIKYKNNKKKKRKKGKSRV